MTRDFRKSKLIINGDSGGVEGRRGYEVDDHVLFIYHGKHVTGLIVQIDGPKKVPRKQDRRCIIAVDPDKVSLTDNLKEVDILQVALIGHIQ